MRATTRCLAVAAASCLLAVGCGDDDASDPDTTSAPTTTAAPSATTVEGTTTTIEPDADVEVLIVLTPDGLGFTTEDSGSVSRIDFGSAEELTVDAIVGSLGDPTDEGPQDECPPGPADIAQFGETITVTSMDGTFVGWTITGSSELTTVDGIGLGTTLEELTAAHPDVEVEQTSLGLEFSAGGFSGTLDGESDDGAIDALWAGTTCIFR
jgi:hypothetical protein